MRNFEVDEKKSTLRKLVIDLTGFGNLVCKIPNEDRIRRKGMTCTNTDGVPLILIFSSREKVLREESEQQIAGFDIAIPIFGLNARFGRQLELDKGGGDGIVLVSVCSPPGRLKVGTAKAVGDLVVDA